MIRPSRRTGGLFAAVLFASLLLLVGWVVGAPVSAAMNCPSPSDGDLLQGPDERFYLFKDRTLHAIPDVETLRALGFDPNGADPIRDDCLRVMRFGDPVPSVGGGGQPTRSAAAPDPAAPRDPAAPAVTLDVSDARPARRSTVRLTARLDSPAGNGLALSIHRTADDGRPGASGLVTTCPGATSCAVEVWEDEARTWVFVATLYRCDTPSSCVAVQESHPVSVTWE